jgi:hypothetical protein
VKRTPLKRKTKLVTKTKPKAKKRTENDYARIYGSRERVAWVQAQPCIACNRIPSENAHIRSGGTGRKADYTQIVPLCRSCHTLQHQKGWKALGLNVARLEYFAFRTQFQWAQTREG